MELLLTDEEKAVFKLRTLYQSYGYEQYKMSKFEEYDFYVKNKDFLISDNVITFTDTNGKLMALKPDVTLSIVKNGKDAETGVTKVYYSENVYRVAKGSQSFKEITQTGLECMGDVDDYCVSEVLYLAVKSLETLSDEYVLDISHMGILSAVIRETGVSLEGQKEIASCVKDKNVHGVVEVLQKEGKEDKAEVLRTIMGLCGSCASVLRTLSELLKGTEGEKYVENLRSVTAGLADKNVRIDFSVLNDMRYYNGIVFQGFIKGVPNSILTGGQYDLLMKKMGRNAEAIGFAVCPKQLEDLQSKEEFDTDVVVVYDEKVALSEIGETMKKIVSGGRSATALKVVPDKLRYKEKIDLRKGE